MKPLLSFILQMVLQKNCPTLNESKGSQIEKVDIIFVVAATFQLTLK